MMMRLSWSSTCYQVHDCVCVAYPLLLTLPLINNFVILQILFVFSFPLQMTWNIQKMESSSFKEIYFINVKIQKQIVDYHEASMYTAPKIRQTTKTVIKRLGPLKLSSFCYSSIVELRSILPILYFGITFSIAFLEWLAC